MTSSSLEKQKSIVFIIEQDHVFRDPMRELIERMGRKVSTARGPYEAKEAANTATSPTLFLIDDFLPARSVRRLVKELREYAQVPIECVVVTSNRHPHAHASSYNMDVYPFCAEFFVGTDASIERTFLAFVRFAERRLFHGIDRITDTITGAYARKGGEMLWVQVWYGAKRNQTWLSMIYLDVDDFKRINDTFRDHVPGDKVLRTIEKVIRRHVRAGDVIIRYGDEFSILLSNTKLEDAKRIAGRIKMEVAKTQVEVRPGILQSTSVSVGVASCDPDHLSANPDHRADIAISDCERLRRKADCEMYKDKQLYKESKKVRFIPR